MTRYLILMVIAVWPLMADIHHLSLRQAIEMLKHNNLELKIARFEARMKALETKAVEGMNYGKVDLTIRALRSNDAGNVFGFKLQSREADFGDFGFNEFLSPLGQALEGANQNALPPGFSQQMNGLLTIQPYDLNYPKARNHFQTTIRYTVPLFTGWKLSEYKQIAERMYRMSRLDEKKTLNMKIYETKKAFYDITLVENYIVNLRKIMRNITKLEDVIRNMQKEGYAKEIDLLEVQARKAEAESMYNQAKLNRDLAYQFLSFLLNREVKSIKRVREYAPMPKVDQQRLEHTNLDIQKAKLGLGVTRHAVAMEKSRFMPEVGAFAEYGSADNSFWNDFTDKDSYTVGVQMKWNAFNGGVDKAKYEEARLKYLQTRNQVALAKKGIALKVRKLRTEILSLDADVRSYKKQLHFARKVYQNYKTRYEEGLASITDVLIKQSKELEMLLKLLQVKHHRNTKVFELESLLNRGGDV